MVSVTVWCAEQQPCFGRTMKRIKRPPLHPIVPRGTKGVEVSCKGKIAWWSLERAQQHAEEINNRLIGDRPVRAYKCRIHASAEDVWHVGRAKKWKQHSTNPVK